MKELVYLSHPYGGNPANLARAKRWAVYLSRKHRNWVIVAPWIQWAELGLFANDEAAGLEACKCAVEGCDRLITVGTRQLTSGMRDEWSHAFANGVEAHVYSSEAEPPIDGLDEAGPEHVSPVVQVAECGLGGHCGIQDDVNGKIVCGDCGFVCEYRSPCLAQAEQNDGTVRCDGGPKSCEHSRTDQVSQAVRRAQAFLDRVSGMLVAKNRAYGDSAANPVRIFSKCSPEEGVRVRLDDKLSRIARGHAAGEDVLLDLCGYVALLAATEEGKA